MKTINLTVGTDINEAAAQLVVSAPSRADFNGITIRAKYATTKPGDIAARYWRLTNLRTIAYVHSPEGKRAEAERRADVVRLQSTIDGLLAALPDFADIPAVLAWVEAASESADHIGVTFDREALRAAFIAGGWGINVNCGGDFDGNDARNFAGWVVGQWLHIWHPGLTPHFIGQWREKFQARAA